MKNKAKKTIHKKRLNTAKTANRGTRLWLAVFVQKM